MKFCAEMFLLFKTSQVLGCPQVRPLWSTIDGMLSATKEEQHAVDCVLKGDVDQYVLDGTNRSLNIPQCLLARIEQLPHQVRVRLAVGYAHKPDTGL